MPGLASAGSIDLPTGGSSQVIDTGDTDVTDVLVGNGGTASLTVTGGSTTLTATGDAKVGLDSGTGVLSVLSGGTLNLDDATAFGIGIGTGSTGTVRVSGAGSTLSRLNNKDTNSYVGQDGVGRLEVSDGATLLNSGSVYVGTPTGGKGTFDISGSNTLVSIQGNISLSCALGTSQEECGLKVSDRATLNTYWGGFVGTGGQGNALVTGKGTTWNEFKIFQVGANYNGEATSGVLRIEDGAKVNAYFKIDEPYSVVFGETAAGFEKLLTPVQPGDDETGKIIYEDGGVRYFVDTSRPVTADVTIDGEGSEFNTTSRIRLGYGDEAYLDENGVAISLPVSANVTVSNGGTISAVKERANGTIGGIMFDGRQTYLNIGAKEGDAAQAAGFVNSYYLRFDASDIGGTVGTVVFNHTSDDFELWSEMVGKGALRAISGDTTLSGQSADFTGSLYARGSTVRVAGLLGPDSTATVDTGALLTGTGTIGSATVKSGGRLGGGGRETVGTLALASDLTVEDGGAIRVRFDDQSNNDQVNVAGDATFAAGAKLVVDRLPGGRISLDQRHLVMTVDGKRTGQLDAGAGTTLSNFYSLSIAYDQEGVDDPTFVYLDPEQTKSYTDVAKITRNQRHVAGVLQGMSVEDPVVNAVAWLPDDAAARNAYDQLSGVLYPDLALALADEIGSVSDIILQRATAADETRGPQLWLSALGGRSNHADDGNAPGFDASVYGLLAGLDYRAASGMKAGAAIGVSNGTTSADGNLGEGDTNTLHGGAYLGYDAGAFSLIAGGNAASAHVDASRHVSFGTLAEQLDDDMTVTGGQLFAELAYRQSIGATGYLQPFARFAYVATSSFDVNETGGDAALEGDVHSSSQDWGTLGLRMGAGLTADAQWRVDGTLGYRRLLGGETAAASLALDGSGTFVVDAADLPENVGFLDLGLEGQLTDSTSLRLSYDGNFASDYWSQSVSALVAWKF